MKKTDKLLRAAFDAGLHVLPLPGDFRTGRDGVLLCAANASTFAQGFYDEGLTTYLMGWTDPQATEAVLQSLAPEIPVPRKFNFKKGINDEAFLSEDDDVRAIDGAFKEVKYTGENQLAETQNKGLTLIIDRDRFSGEGAMALDQLQQWFTTRLWQRLLRNEIRRSWKGLTTAVTATNLVWNTQSDPDGELLAMLEDLADNAGMYPNQIRFGSRAWVSRQIAVRAQLNAGSLASAGLNVQQVAEYLGLEKGDIVRGRYTVSTGKKAGIAGQQLVMFSADEGQMIDDPSNIKRFTSAVEGGGKRRVYLDTSDAKLMKLTIEHYSKIVVPSTAGMLVANITTQAPSK